MELTTQKCAGSFVTDTLGSSSKPTVDISAKIQASSLLLSLELGSKVEFTGVALLFTGVALLSTFFLGGDVIMSVNKKLVVDMTGNRKITAN